MYITVILGLAASVLAANNVPQHVVYTAEGASPVVGNHFGCVNIKPAGQNSQLGCVKHVFTDGFTVGVTDSKTKNVTLCSVAGTKGACGPAGVNVQVDLTGGTGKAPAASGPGGTKTLTPAQLVNKPIRRSPADFDAEARSFMAEERSADSEIIYVGDGGIEGGEGPGEQD